MCTLVLSGITATSSFIGLHIPLFLLFLNIIIFVLKQTILSSSQGLDQATLRGVIWMLLWSHHSRLAKALFLKLHCFMVKRDLDYHMAKNRVRHKCHLQCWPELIGPQELNEDRRTCQLRCKKASQLMYICVSSDASGRKIFFINFVIHYHDSFAFCGGAMVSENKANSQVSRGSINNLLLNMYKTQAGHSPQ